MSIYKYYKNKRILITGGSGFIAQNLVKKLLKFESKITLIDKENNNLLNSNTNIIKCDIYDFTKLNKIILEISPQITFHLAAFIDRDINFEILRKMIKINILGTVNVLESVKNSKKCNSIIIAGTCEEYGYQKSKFKEHYKENPVSPYSFSKVCNSYLCNMLMKNYQLPIILLRPSLAYGPGQKESMFIPAMINKLNNNEIFEMTFGEQTRDFIYISDLIDAYLKAGIVNKYFGEIFNIGFGKSYKIKNIANLIASYFGKKDLIKLGKIKYRKAEIMRYEIDISKANKLLKWKPKVGINKGIKNTIESYLNV